MNCNDSEKQAIIQFIKDSLKPIEAGEVIANKGIASHKGYLRRWFTDILEGEIPLINISPQNRIIIKWHYSLDISWRMIAGIVNQSPSTLKERCDRVFSDIVDNMPGKQREELLRIINETESARYEHDG